METTVNNFSRLRPANFDLWDIIAVRVLCILPLAMTFEYNEFGDTDTEEGIFMILLDDERVKLLARVSQDMRSYVLANVRANEMYRIKRCTVGLADNYRYEGYKPVVDDREILIARNTTIVAIGSVPNFPIYPNISNISQITEIRRGRYLTDVLGQVSNGKLIEYYDCQSEENEPAVELSLLDHTASVISLIIMEKFFRNTMQLFRAIESKSIIFVTRVKVIAVPPSNILLATYFSTFDFDPVMPQSEDLRLRLRGQR